MNTTSLILNVKISQYFSTLKKLLQGSVNNPLENKIIMYNICCELFKYNRNKSVIKFSNIGYYSSKLNS
jgi:hypothetical protein